MAFAQDESAPSQYGNWNVGHQVVQADTGANRPMDIDVWFPTGADTTELAPARYGLTASGTTMLSRMAFETDQVVSGQQFPLIVYAHGATGKSVDNTVFAESLASNGFVVATTTHLDGGVPLEKPSSSFERTQDVTSIIDVMFAKSGTEQDAFFGLIDEAAVGVAGHSFGGSTALAMAGGIETETRTVLPDERVRAIMPIAQGDPYGQSTDLSKVDVPTLLFVGNQDEFGENLFAPDQLVALASQDKFLAIVDGATHLDVGVSTLQQSEVLEIPVPADPVLGTPEFIFTLPLPVATEFSNGETLRLESLFGVSFFTEFLKGDDSFANVLTPSYVAQNEPLVEFTGFVDGQPLGVPEPGSFMLAAVALGGIPFCARRHRRRQPNNHTPI